MKKNKMLLLLAVLAVMILCYFGLTKWNTAQEKKEAGKLADDKIKVTDISDLTTISYTYDGNDFKFEKQDGSWLYSADNTFPLDQSYPETMEKTFGSLTAVRELENMDSLADYGLENPKYQIHLKDSDGNETTLYIGNAADENYYLTAGDKSRVYTVGSSVISCISYSLNQMIQMETFPAISSSAVTSVTLTSSGGTKTYASGNEEDKEALTAIGGGIGAVTFSECVEYNVKDTDLSGYGLDSSTRTMVEVVYTSEDEEQTARFYAGSSDSTGKYRYLQLEGSKMVYTVSKETLDTITEQK